MKRWVWIFGRCKRRANRTHEFLPLQCIQGSGGVGGADCNSAHPPKVPPVPSPAESESASRSPRKRNESGLKHLYMPRAGVATDGEGGRFQFTTLASADS